MIQRGRIYNRERAKQQRDFRAMLFPDKDGNMMITPTDIDMAIEMHGKLFIFAETKYSPAPIENLFDVVPFGQRLALERMISSLTVPAICFVSRHNTPVEQDIDMAETIVEWAYCNKFRGPNKWTNLAPIRLIDVSNKFIATINSFDK